MYKDGFAFAVKFSGGPLSEFNQIGETAVLLPFGSEFELFLKNTNSKRAVAEILINGVRALENDLLLEPKSATTIECFQPSRKRFKFDREGVKGNYAPGDCDNGIVEINFRLEEDKPVTKAVEHHHYGYFPYGRHRTRRTDVWVGMATGGSTFETGNIRSCSVNHAYTSQVSDTVGNPILNDGPSLSEDMFAQKSGVVVEGSASDQKMRTVDGFHLEESVTTFRIKLVGQTLNNKVVKPVTTKERRKKKCECGTKIGFKASFCSGCGKELVQPVV